MHKIYKSDLIINNQKEIIKDLEYIKNKNLFKDYTWEYYKYNVFVLNSNSIILNKLCNELRTIIRRFLKTKEPLWFQSWINFHYKDEVLQKHNHDWPYHGYISIRPFDTTTVFDGYEIKNEIGNIYIGPGYVNHFVKVNSSFKKPRITLGFDVKTKKHKTRDMLSLIPV